MSDPCETTPMFEVPEKYRPPDRPQTAEVVWADWKGARTSCDHCLKNIATGESRHFSEAAKFTRTTAEGREFLCYRHGHASKLGDEMAGRLKKKR